MTAVKAVAIDQRGPDQSKESMTEILDGIARNLAKKPLHRLNPQERQAVLDIARKIGIQVPDVISIENKRKAPLDSWRENLSPEAAAAVRDLSPEITAILRAACKKHRISLSELYSSSHERRISECRRQIVIELRNSGGFTMRVIADIVRRNVHTVKWYLAEPHTGKKVKPYGGHRANPAIHDHDGRIRLLEAKVAEQAEAIERLIRIIGGLPK